MYADDVLITASPKIAAQVIMPGVRFHGCSTIKVMGIIMIV
jgi:hypothetical protein